MPKPTRRATKPKLLTGGNPQIAKADGHAPVQAYLDAIPPGWKQDLARQLDALIVQTLPDIRKAVRWNSPFYGTDAQGWFLSFHCMTRYLKIAFFNGVSVNPLPPESSKVKNVRYLHLHEGDTIDQAQLTSWIRQASELPGERMF